MIEAKVVSINVDDYDDVRERGALANVSSVINNVITRIMWLYKLSYIIPR